MYNKDKLKQMKPNDLVIVQINAHKEGNRCYLGVLDESPDEDYVNLKKHMEIFRNIETPYSHQQTLVWAPHADALRAKAKFKIDEDTFIISGSDIEKLYNNLYTKPNNNIHLNPNDVLVKSIAIFDETPIDYESIKQKNVKESRVLQLTQGIYEKFVDVPETAKSPSLKNYLKESLATFIPHVCDKERIHVESNRMFLNFFLVGSFSVAGSLAASYWLGPEAELDRLSMQAGGLVMMANPIICMLSERYTDKYYEAIDKVNDDFVKKYLGTSTQQ